MLRNRSKIETTGDPQFYRVPQPQDQENAKRMIQNKLDEIKRIKKRRKHLANEVPSPPPQHTLYRGLPPPSWLLVAGVVHDRSDARLAGGGD